jgi:hypothetical protein
MDFFERLFGMSLDGGSGLAEMAFVLFGVSLVAVLPTLRVIRRALART